MPLLSTIADIQEFLRIGRAYFWPGGVIIVAIIVFGPEFRKFLAEADWFKGGASGLELGRRRQTGNPPQPPGDDPPVEAEPPSPPPEDNATVEQLQPYVYYWFYEKTYRLLLPIQIQFLIEVNQRAQGMTALQASQFFWDFIISQGGHREDFGTWNLIEFLSNSRLIETALMPPNDQKYLITPLGKAFLQWMVAEGLSTKK